MKLLALLRRLADGLRVGRHGPGLRGNRPYRRPILTILLAKLVAASARFGSRAAAAFPCALVRDACCS